MISILPITSKCSCVPLPVLPMKPDEWESSTKSSASYFSHRSTISSSFARSPSMEKTPSVITNFILLSACSCSFCSRCCILECLKVSCSALQSLMPSIIEAWTSLSDIIMSSLVSRASKTPALASMHEGKRMVSSVPRNSVTLSSSSLCISCVPQIKRTDDMP